VSIWVQHRFGLFYLISLIAVLIHIGSDILNAYGTQALWPVSKRRFALDTIFVTDFVLIVLGFTGIALTVSGWPIAKAVTWFGGGAALYLVLRATQTIYLHHKVRQQYPSEWRVTLVPRPLPWWWSYVAESQTHIIAGQVTLSGVAKPEVRWPKAGFHSELARFVFRHTELGQTFQWFARHLLWSVTTDGDTLRVSMADAVYRYNRMFPFSAYVTVTRDPNGDFELVEESLRGQVMDLKSLFQDAQDIRDEERAEFIIPPPNP